jgi:hypothetical protein
MPSFKGEVQVYGEREYVGNALRFETESEAEMYVVDLAWRWTLVENWRVVPSEDKPNHTYVEGKLEAIKESEDEHAR